MLKPANRPLAYDCAEFNGDRPCRWQKFHGLQCHCDHYSPVQGNILIIKLDAMGDVLRTTCILPALAAAHPRKRIWWLTRKESVDFFIGNPYVAGTLAYRSDDTLLHLLTMQFDLVINLDAGRTSCELATLARATRKLGFVLNEYGHVHAMNDAALAWLEMGVYDDLKKKNVLTYQRIMAEILGLPPGPMPYVFSLLPAERDAAQSLLESVGFRHGPVTVGLNPGAGGRWQYKQWREDGFLLLLGMLRQRYRDGVQVVLLGGESELARNERIKKLTPVPLVDPGCRNTLRMFASIVSFCDVVVTGDTLAMHIALALNRRVVVLFGPTSHTEIELYGLGEKVIPPLSCLCCYKQTCELASNCMQMIGEDVVLDSVGRQVQNARSSQIG